MERFKEWRISLAWMTLLVLMSALAHAQGPEVSSVTFLQGDDGAGGTHVDIYYDLMSPSGPCEVTVWLSKDDGATFPFPVTSVTGDVGSGVAPGAGKHIVWSIAADYPDETIAQAQIQVVADDGLPEPGIEFVDVPGGTFEMGRRDDGDDGTHGGSDELPRHTVTLSAYKIGKYEVTNGAYAAVLNWALGQGYLEDSGGGAYSGGDVYKNGQILLEVDDADCQIEYGGGTFVVESRDAYSMESHPVVEVSWYGSVAFCNWLSEMHGLTPCYDLSTWALTVPYPNGYRLPTEAEWERAAAWDGAKHWIYGFISDTLTGKDRCNYCDSNPDYVNPLGLTSEPYTSPVGWFDGVNVSPNGPVTTVDSPSPAGCYGMSGNVWDWVHDWHASDYYTTGGPPWNDPTGPASGSLRVSRGGAWGDDNSCRSAGRNGGGSASGGTGFRVARS